MKPLLFVTGHAPAYRVGALARLHELEQIELALFGGRSTHGGPNSDEALPFPHRHVQAGRLAALAASGRYRAVVCPTGGRLAPLATWAGARRGGIPLILWASLWAHPRSAAHALTYLPLRRLYRSADAVVTYGPHVSAYVTARGAHNVHIAPQSVDNGFWRSVNADCSGHPLWPAADGTRFLFVGRAAREKGLEVLLRAWLESGLRPPAAALVIASTGEASVAPEPVAETEGVLRIGAMGATELRDTYAACQVLVVPSIRTRTFREPWGLVVNEAMNRGLAVIATDAVGAAAGGLVRNGENGLVVAAGDHAPLAAAMRRLAADRRLCADMGAAGETAVEAFSHDAWAKGFSDALLTLDLSRGRW